MGSNGGTGQPLWFVCAAARRDRYSDRQTHVVALTGRTRPRSRHTRGRMTDTYREYRCACGYTGWSAHVDLARKVPA